MKCLYTTGPNLKKKTFTKTLEDEMAISFVAIGASLGASSGEVHETAEAKMNRRFERYGVALRMVKSNKEEAASAFKELIQDTNGLVGADAEQARALRFASLKNLGALIHPSSYFESKHPTFDVEHNF